ncbi:tRNA (adenosine(37)-N6)-threonylcarbamoyltransferase complex ATPase subunit type 1 TsaE [Flavobacterium sp. xlx-214]|uniref:tRNA (adenosine(37)-N6)-threonylcarbamoyltransferase complex ATPase subunit type 1 TsaE n=1 Tax=unclassified Flavobacterium TaxID=196869 RepID=UPI0013D7A145|nr:MULTISPECIES: tRNA (adenosine(37)-N6)-threonylcarbamoyltransferase complex ATPase subunit type 1 TsaE [unclassified Flavobacterium]MBA5793736.1 tRNA (adenosine(37)-N6)-threonylcarbamoyltransferase complex ATPase subunit type 1 TsaE [Flavobacterium sp. xlx-221]QMI83243.1 tRNA (adenosine(37)-N6)-threonylcarbamoyltransferase complex ATPase subunit type 1 TsaE [Flavobacterium sp. xlx-214]
MNCTYSINDLDTVSKQLIKASKYKTWIFNASMGAGKTTLIKAIVKNLGVNDVANSPTFSIVNEYLGNNNEAIYHFDLYRLKNNEEAYDMGLDEYFDDDNWCFVEWPNQAESILPDNFHTISINIIDKNTRELNFD